MVYHRFRGKYSAPSQENRNNLDNTSLASSADFHLGFVVATVEATRLYIKYMRQPPFPDGFKKTNKETNNKQTLRQTRKGYTCCDNYQSCPVMTTNVAIWDGANVRILMDEVFFRLRAKHWRLWEAFCLVELSVSNLIQWGGIYELFYRYIVFLLDQCGFDRGYAYRNYDGSFALQFGMNKNMLVDCHEYTCSRIWGCLNLTYLEF